MVNHRMTNRMLEYISIQVYVRTRIHVYYTFYTFHGPPSMYMYAEYVLPFTFYTFTLNSIVCLSVFTVHTCIFAHLLKWRGEVWNGKT